MNIFILDTDIEKCAQYHVDKHCVKMILEYAQLLSTTVNLSGGTAPYKTTHKNHPCAIWARDSLSNWHYLRDLGITLHKEYQYRYGKTHKSGLVIESLGEPNIPDIGLTPFAQAMPDEYKCDDAVIAYRNYYLGAKANLFSWKDREVPEWIETF